MSNKNETLNKSIPNPGTEAKNPEEKSEQQQTDSGSAQKQATPASNTTELSKEVMELVLELRDTVKRIEATGQYQVLRPLTANDIINKAKIIIKRQFKRGNRTKNGEDRIVLLNRTSRAIIENQRGYHDEFVFTCKGEPVQRINGHAWRSARKRANLEQCRVHDLRHTFGSRLRAAGVSFENRQDLLGHKSSRITDHYCKAEIDELKEAVEKISRVNLAQPYFRHKKSSRQGMITACFTYRNLVGRMRFERMTIALKELHLILTYCIYCT